MCSATRAVVGYQLHDRCTAGGAEAPRGNATAGAVAIIAVDSCSTAGTGGDFCRIRDLLTALDVCLITHHRVVLPVPAVFSIWSR
jgi:hypothetical protein